MATGMTPAAAADRAGDSGSRPLLGWGMVVGPFYLALGVAQGLLRDGFDFGRHPLSVLANGPGGWIQVANFVLSGLMVLAVAVGLGRALGRGSRGLRWSLAAFGVSMLVAAVFRADPVDGFPPGTPEGFPTSISTTGLIHFAAGALGFVSLAVGGFFGAWTFFRRRATVPAVVSLLAGLSVFIGFFGGPLFGPAGIAGIWFAVVAGFAWLAYLSWHLSRAPSHG